MAEMNDIIELPEGIFFLNINYQYQWKEPSLKAKYNNRTYKTGSSRGISNMNFKLITCECKIYVASNTPKLCIK